MANVIRRGPDLFIHGAAEIAYPLATEAGVFRGTGHALFIRDRVIDWAGPEAEAPPEALAAPRLDAAGGAVLPALVDAHTHLVFGGDRVADFARRTCGESYQAIAAAGGGIRSTVSATREASLDALVDRTRAALEGRLRSGIVTHEIKTGYGLSVAQERKMLDAIHRLAREGWDLEPTLLAAHAVPPDQSREAYLRSVVDALIPHAAAAGLARFCDVFVEQGAYTVAEGARVFDAARRHGLIPKVHADQLSPGGGAQLAARVEAASADHLEHIDDEGVRALAEAGVVAVLLPGAMVYLGDRADGLGRRLVDARVEVAVATDFNPGSSPTHNLPLMATIACTQMGLTAEESLRAITRGAANALRRPDIGHFDRGARGRCVILDAPDSRALVAAFGEPVIRDVVLCDFGPAEPRSHERSEAGRR